MILLFRNVNGHSKMAGKAIEVQNDSDALEKIIENNPQFKNKISIKNKIGYKRTIMDLGPVGWIYDTEEDFCKCNWVSSISEFNESK
jgi:hypothetical protein